MFSAIIDVNVDVDATASELCVHAGVPAGISLGLLVTARHRSSHIKWHAARLVLSLPGS